LINEKKTFFLNGPWGSGKTEFLNMVSDQVSEKKFIYLNLWELKDERTVIHIGVNQLFHKWYIFFKILFVICVAISILATPVINLGLEGILPSILIKCAGVIALLVAIYQFFKIKSDQFFYSILKCNRIDKLLKNKVLVVDDFDRVSVNKQDEAYKLFNILHNRLPIIFVGDIKKVPISGDNYLQKIIDKRIDLPYVLHSRDIWNNYFKKLEKTFDVVLPADLLDLFITENRNLRDRVQFNDYVNQEFFLHGKKDHVQCGQQLVIIYIYLFHYTRYTDLLKYGYVSSKKDELEQTISDLLGDNNDYPVSFAKSKEMYFISESVSNMTEKEINDILNDFENINENILKKGDYNGDLYNYLMKKYDQLEDEIQNIILNAAIQNTLNNDYNDLSKLIISFEKEKIREKSLIQKTDIEKRIYENWSKKLAKYRVDLSQKLKFIEMNSILSFDTLSKIEPDIDVFSEEYSDQTEKLYYLLTYLSKLDLWQKFDKWTPRLWDKIEELYHTNPNHFLLYFRFNGLLGIAGRRMDFLEENDLIRNYVVYKKVKSLDNPNIEIKYIEDTIKKIKPKLNELGSLGYHFEYLDEKE